MRNFFKVIFFCISLCACKDNYSVNLPNNKNDFISMSCSDLMLHLIEDSSYGNTFLDKKLALEFFFERIDVDHIILKFVRGAGVV